MAKQKLGTKLYNSPYILDKFIATGGMNSEIYICHDPKHPNKTLVAKIIYFAKENDKDIEKQINDFHDIYHRESVTSLRLFGKPNLVQTCEHFRGDDKTEVIIQEYVEGTSLQQFIEKKGIVTPRVALSIFKQILIGVEAMHHQSHQIIHCDLKPQNIMISKDLSKITIIDFGISSVLQLDQEQHIIRQLTKNQIHGTEGYVSPDIFNKGITVQYDFYSLGAILYMMLMREFPFKKEEEKNKNNGKKLTPEQLEQAEIRRIRKTIDKPLTFDMVNISSNPTIPVSLENLIFRCLACKPQDLKYRYNDISEIINDVDKIIQQIDRHINNEKLIKPLKDRSYEIPHNIVLSRLKDRNPMYQKWWFFFTLVGAALAIIIPCIIFFCIKK